MQLRTEEIGEAGLAEFLQLQPGEEIRAVRWDARRRILQVWVEIPKGPR